MSEITMQQLSSLLIVSQDIRDAMDILNAALLQQNKIICEIAPNLPAVSSEAAREAALEATVDAAIAAREEDLEPEWYLVSIGDGSDDDGVLRTHPDYYVKTDKPYDLALAGLLKTLHARYVVTARKNAWVSGDPKLGISAVLSGGPNGETAFNKAWRICRVWPVDTVGEDGYPKTAASKSCFESLDTAFPAELLALVDS